MLHTEWEGGKNAVSPQHQHPSLAMQLTLMNATTNALATYIMYVLYCDNQDSRGL